MTWTVFVDVTGAILGTVDAPDYATAMTRASLHWPGVVLEVASAAHRPAPPPTLSPTADLASLLKRASDAHHEYEKTHGPDPDWWQWYAAFMTREATITITPRLVPLVGAR